MKTVFKCTCHFSSVPSSPIQAKNLISLRSDKVSGRKCNLPLKEKQISLPLYNKAGTKVGEQSMSWVRRSEKNKHPEIKITCFPLLSANRVELGNFKLHSVTFAEGVRSRREARACTFRHAHTHTPPPHHQETHTQLPHLLSSSSRLITKRCPCPSCFCFNSHPPKLSLERGLSISVLACVFVQGDLPPLPFFLYQYPSVYT